MLQPLRGKIVVDIIPDKKETASGLILADTIKDIPHRGIIIAIGNPYIDNDKELPWYLDIGEIAHFKRQWSDLRIKTVVLRRDDIIAVETQEGSIRAVNDNVIVKRHYEGRIGNSTIFIPDGVGIQSNYEEFHGEVISIGPDNKYGIKVGDKLAYQRNEGIKVKLYEKEYFVLKTRALLAIL